MDSRGQSDLVGTLAVLAVVVVATTTAGAVVLGGALPADRTAAPLGEVAFTADGDDLRIRHRGGDALQTGDLRLVVAGVTDAATVDGVGASFEPGERGTAVDALDGVDGVVRVHLVHEPTNTVVDEGRVRAPADEVTPTPTATPSPTPDPTPTASPSPSPTASPAPTPTATPAPTATPDAEPPTITALRVESVDGDLVVTVRADASLATLTVEVLRFVFVFPVGAETLHREDFSVSTSGESYTYTAVVTSPPPGTYVSVLSDAAGDDGADATLPADRVETVRVD